MIDRGKRSVIGVLVNVIDYESAMDRILSAAIGREPLTITPAASHAIMTGFRDPEYRYRMNHLDLVVPDGQPVRHALGFLHRERLPDRVYGPNLMLATCAVAAEEALPIYLYGSTEEIVLRLRRSLEAALPSLKIVGADPSAFRILSPDEKAEVVERIRSSGARIAFVGLGCPRQEAWIYEYAEPLSMPLMAVGAAFDFHAGTTAQAPRWMQDHSLEWFYRLIQEPRRLWKRYLGLGPAYVGLVLLQRLGLRFDTTGSRPMADLGYG